MKATLKNGLLAAATAGVMTLAMAGSASALSLNLGYTGGIKLTVSDFDAGAVGYGTTPPGAPGTVICGSSAASLADITACNAAASAPAPNAATLANGLPESTWAIARITAIEGQGPGNPLLWSPGVGGVVEITAMLTGLQDYKVVDNGNGTVTAYAIGGRLQVFVDGNSDYNGGLGPAGRTGDLTYTNVTDGDLWLDIDLSASADAAESAATWKSNFDDPIGDTEVGSAAGCGVITGGNGAAQFVSGTIGLPFCFGGSPDDVYLSTTLTIHPSPTPGSVDYGWTVNSATQVFTSVVPEPGSLALLGTGLLVGAGFYRKRRKAA
jgi:hypothetical protein